MKWPEKSIFKCQLKPQNTGQKKNQENCVDSLLPFGNFCRVLVKRVRISRFNTLLFAPYHQISFHGIGILSIRIVFWLNLVDLESQSLCVKIESGPVTLPHM